MKLQVGDIVRYLNDVGGGVVRKILSNSMVEITDDSGFDIPVLERDLVLIERPELIQSSVTEKYTPEIIAEIETEELEGNDELHYYLAYTHVDKSSQEFYVYVINDTNYFANYVVTFQKENNTEFVDAGVLEPNTKVCITQVSYETISSIETITFQCIPFKNKEYEIKKPIEIIHKIQHVKFYKPGVFIVNDFFEEDAFVVDIFKENIVEFTDEHVKNQLIREFNNKIAIDTKNATNEQANSKKQEITKEVDLHIHELVENELGMDAAAKLEMQMSVFEKELHAALQSNCEKIIFIHGVGNGVLKAKIRGILDRDYKYLFYQDASFQKYKFGATLIYLKRLRK